MMRRAVTTCISLVVLAACSEEPPPRSTQEFLDNPMLLEAAMVRCARNRTETRYAAECVNAREAVKIIEAREDASRRAELEAISEQKRRALRQTQAAVAEARRRAAEEERLRKEAEYLAQFGELPPEAQSGEVDSDGTPVAAPAVPEEGGAATPGGASEVMSPDSLSGTDAEAADSTPPDDASTLESIREELRRRQTDDDQ